MGITKIPSRQQHSDNLLRGFHLGTEVEKGIVLTDKYLIDHEEQVRKMCDIFAAYPDLFLDMIAPEDSEFSLFFYQRITLRAIMRYKAVYVTAPRAFSKSFLTILGMVLQCVFLPGKVLCPLAS